MANETLHVDTGQLPASSPAAPKASGNLGARIALRLVLVPAFGAALLFGVAGDLRFWQGWAFLACAVLPAAAAFLMLVRADRHAAEMRLESREDIASQRLLINSTKLVFLAAFLLPCLDHRLGWSLALGHSVPPWLSAAADALIVANMALLGWVVEVNRYAARTIRVQPGQTVVTRGPYGFVRHPMYSASLAIWMATPVALGSWLSLPAFALLIPFYVLRLLGEEKFLRQYLDGYSAYCRRTPFRLVPFIW
ncbi:MAG: isoprenylcysteine carboxylmethyltransferase family protein [Terracidiphilus sp.]